jgi:hypothetical protein
MFHFAADLRSRCSLVEVQQAAEPRPPPHTVMFHFSADLTFTPLAYKS